MDLWSILIEGIHMVILFITYPTNIRELNKNIPFMWNYLDTLVLPLELALDFPEEERMMQQSSVSISLGF